MRTHDMSSGSSEADSAVGCRPVAAPFVLGFFQWFQDGFMAQIPYHPNVGIYGIHGVFGYYHLDGGPYKPPNLGSTGALRHL